MFRMKNAVPDRLRHKFRGEDIPTELVREHLVGMAAAPYVQRKTGSLVPVFLTFLIYRKKKE